MAVNNVSGNTDKIALQVLQDSRLEFTLRRPVKMTIEIDRTGKSAPLGLGLDYILGGGCLLVTEITEGLVKQWNVENFSKQIKPLARIVSVNGHVGNVERMLHECKTQL